MRFERRDLVRRVRFFVLASVVLLIALGANGCGDRTVKNALEIILERLETHKWGEIETEDLANLRIHVYRERIDTGDWVGPFVPGGEPVGSDRIVCASSEGCLLFFVDTDHWAHFAHTTVIALWRLDGGGFHDPVVGEWWPLHNGTPIFDKVRKREDWFNRADPDEMQTIVFPTGLPKNLTPGFIATDEMGISVIESLPTQSPSRVLMSGIGSDEDCAVWAVIVNGYDDDDDTFHIDTGGMYQVLRGHGIPQSQIQYLCPDPAGSAGCEIVASETNLETALTVTMGDNIPPTATLADSTCQELLFFYSAHGNSDILWCGDDQPTFSQLNGWLDQVKCANITVVVEACNSGGLIEVLDSPPAGQTRFIFTSTDQGGKSYRDMDKIDELKDTNPGDIGSETVWGYVEAFGTGSADESGEMEMSFSEAADFAILNDITVEGGNQPGKYPDGSTTAEAHACAGPPTAPKLRIELTQDVPTPSAGFPQLLRCRCNGFSATISHPGGDPPPVATARFYWTAASDPQWLKNCEPDDSGSVICETDVNQVWDSTRIIGSHQDFPVTLDVFWDVGSDIEAGTEITLLAIADSPHAKIPHGADISLSDLVEIYDQADALTMEVVNPSSCFIFPCGCRTVRCD